MQFLVCNKRKIIGIINSYAKGTDMTMTDRSAGHFRLLCWIGLHKFANRCSCMRCGRDNPSPMALHAFNDSCLCSVCHRKDTSKSPRHRLDDRCMCLLCGDICHDWTTIDRKETFLDSKDATWDYPAVRTEVYEVVESLKCRRCGATDERRYTTTYERTG